MHTPNFKCIFVIIDVSKVFQSLQRILIILKVEWHFGCNDGISIILEILVDILPFEGFRGVLVILKASLQSIGGFEGICIILEIFKNISISLEVLWYFTGESDELSNNRITKLTIGD